RRCWPSRDCGLPVHRFSFGVFSLAFELLPWLRYRIAMTAPKLRVTVVDGRALRAVGLFEILTFRRSAGWPQARNAIQSDSCTNTSDSARLLAAQIPIETSTRLNGLTNLLPIATVESAEPIDPRRSE